MRDAAGHPDATVSPPLQRSSLRARAVFHGIRLMLGDPTGTLDAALTAVWRQVSAALGLPAAVPTERGPGPAVTDPGPALSLW
ncbi:hypothetical protein [Streptomyces luteogriseus]|uniref:hypothetical protein n=1 Tax=Streptomyces luteogriseus TaxID=68233 RepID=UPI0038233341